MRTKIKYLIFLIHITFIVNHIQAQQKNEIIELDTWEASKANIENWFPAKVPSTIHSLLNSNRRIADPYRGDIESRLQFIGNSDWVYKKTINVSSDQLKANQVMLQFLGLDTYSVIYINHRKIFSTDNMFRSYEFDIKQALKPGENLIEVYFLAPLVYTKKFQDSLSVNFPGGQRVFTRKAQFQFGWDWAPTYIAMGIWKPVYLKYLYKPSIKNLDINYVLHDDEVVVQVSAEIFAYENSKFYAETVLDGQIQSRNVNFSQGLNKLVFDFKIKKPLLWWPNGMGKQNLYQLTFKGGQIGKEEVITKKIGFRKIELVTKPDNQGESFYFKINDRPLFAKGANYVPADVFPEQVTPEKTLSLLSDAKRSNFNMLRVWGGGIYESDHFYEICDSLGLLVWQDFMFACAMYPGDESFLQNVEIEAEENVKRISQHPSKALWCGNNENSEGWERWGWKEGQSPANKDYLEKAYTKVFNEILPTAVKNWGKNVPYWESSPKFGRGDIRHRFEGDAHYWGVWHDAEDFSKYEEKVPRFMSEFGFQSYPEISTLRYFSGMDLDQNEISILAHQKHDRGNELLSIYISRDFRPAKDFESFVYLSQVVQAEGIGRGIAAHRSAMPFCMGSLYWQFNDCWPAISWSSIDYFGRWKALQYKAKSLFQQTIINAKVQNNKLTAMLVTENENEQNMELEISSFTLDGKEVAKTSKSIVVKPFSSTEIINLDVKDQIEKYGSKNLCFVSRLKTSQGKLVFEDFDFAESPKDLNLMKDKLSFTVKEIKEGYIITIQSDAINPGILISTDLKGTFSENYFSMSPGTKEVYYYTTEPAKDLNKAFKIMTWVNAME